MAEACKAPGQSCGTPAGWRQGGRCSNCRSAHNADTRDRRREQNTPPDDTVNTLVHHLQTGQDLTTAAKLAGIHPRTAAALAAHDARVIQALAPTASQAARQSAYLKALLDHQGVKGRAAAAAGVAEATVTLWRDSEAFAQAEQALRQFTKGAQTNPHRDRRAVTPDQLEVFLVHLRLGDTYDAAAAVVGITPSSVRYHASRNEAFAERLHAIRPKRSRSRKPLKLGVPEEDLRRDWLDPTISLKELTRKTGLTAAQLRYRTAALGLPTQRQVLLAPRASEPGNETV